MNITVDQEVIEQLIQDGEWTEVEEMLPSLPPPAIAYVLTAADEERGLDLFRKLPEDLAAGTFPHLPLEHKRRLLEALPHRDLSRILNDLPADDRTQFLEDLTPAELQRMLSLLTVEHRREAMELLQYPEGSVGRLMSPSYVSVNAHWTVQQVLEHLRRREVDPEMIHTIYVVDRSSRLIDELPLPQLVLADPASTVEELMDENFVALSPEDDREEAVEMIERYDTTSLPVTNSDGILIGVVTFDDVMDVAEEEATEDFQRQANIEPLGARYPHVGIGPLFLRRIPWLAALIGVYLIASGVVSSFEEVLSAEVVLASFIPMLMGSGGNVGAQAGTLTVRALATGELSGRLWLKAFVKEIWVGSVLGLTMGFLAAVVGYIYGGGPLAAVIGSAMLVIVVVSNLFLIVLPFLMERIGVDPSVPASPGIAALTVITSLLIFFGIATRLLGLG